MPAITSIGHVGLYCKDVARQADFYQRVLGFHITDQDAARGFYFFSSQPAAEHHMLLLRPGRTDDAEQFQQLSFHTGSLGEVREYWQRLVAEGARIDRTITHGNAVSVYFYDPEGNRLEIYWDTNLPVHQPFSQPLDLSADDAGVMAQVDAAIDRIGRPWDPSQLCTFEAPPAAALT